MSAELVLKEYRAEIHPAFDGLQAVVMFSNGYGASVINHFASHGLELAVVVFHGPGFDDFSLVYDTPVTSDVLGHLSEDELRATLAQIENLPPRTAEVEA